MRQRALVILLAGCLLGLAPQPVEAAVTRKWGQVLDSYGARLFACKMPERTDIGTRWRIHVRAVNRSPVTVRVSVLVRRWVVRQGETITKQAWARDLAPGVSTPVGAVRAYDHKVGEGRFFDYVDFRVRRTNDARVLEWPSMYPTGVPRCDLPVSAISWQGSGYVSQTKGRMQICANMILDGNGPEVLWRFRGDATQAQRTLNYQAKVYRNSDFQVSGSWSRTIPPGGYTEPGSLSQSIAPGPPGQQAETFDIDITEEGTSSTSFGGRGSPRNVC
jgi:hypothetical protein